MVNSGETKIIKILFPLRKIGHKLRGGGQENNYNTASPAIKRTHTLGAFCLALHVMLIKISAAALIA